MIKLKLKLSNNKFLKILANALSKNKNLKRLHVAILNCSISDDEFTFFSASLMNFPQLESLELDFTGNNITDQSFEALTFSIQHFVRLEKLHLIFPENKLTINSSEQLANVLQLHKNLNSLRLSFRNNEILNEGVLSLLKSITKLKQSQQATLLTDLQIYLSTSTLSKHKFTKEVKDQIEILNNLFQPN